MDVPCSKVVPLSHGYLCLVEHFGGSHACVRNPAGDIACAAVEGLAYNTDTGVVQSSAEVGVSASGFKRSFPFPAPMLLLSSGCSSRNKSLVR